MCSVPYADFNCLSLPKDAREKEDDYVMLSYIFPTGWRSTELAGVLPGRRPDRPPQGMVTRKCPGNSGNAQRHLGHGLLHEVRAFGRRPIVLVVTRFSPEKSITLTGHTDMAGLRGLPRRVIRCRTEQAILPSVLWAGRVMAQNCCQWWPSSGRWPSPHATAGRSRPPFANPCEPCPRLSGCAGRAGWVPCSRLSSALRWNVAG